jgi:hypothetical protein
VAPADDSVSGRRRRTTAFPDDADGEDGDPGVAPWLEDALGRRQRRRRDGGAPWLHGDSKGVAPQIDDDVTPWLEDDGAAP